MRCALDELRLDVNGEVLVLDPSGALYWPGEETLVVADLHFEKGSSFARGGTLLPPYDTINTISRLEAALERRAVRRVIALGDSFHDREAASRLGPEERARLTDLARRAHFIWIAGNHDPEPPAWLGGAIASEVAIGGLLFRHEPLPPPQRGEVAGHLHPSATVVRRGRSLRRRCFVSDGERLVLPAFGAYAGGLDVREDAIASLFARSLIAYLLGARRVYAAAVDSRSHRLWRNAQVIS